MADNADTDFPDLSGNGKGVATGVGREGLREQLASDAGLEHVQYKRSEANTFGRTVAQLVSVGALLDSNSVMHWIDPDLDEALLAGTNTTDLSTYIQNAIDDISASAAAGGRKSIQFSKGLIYKVGTSIVDFSVEGLVVHADGATLSAEIGSLRQMLTISADNVTIRGLRTLIVAASSEHSWCYEITGANCKLDDVTVERENAGDGTTIYVRGAGSAGFQLLQSRIINSKNVNFIGTSDVLIQGTSFVGGPDDAIAINTTTGLSKNFKIIGCHFDGAASFVAIGSFVGSIDADDPTYSNIVRNVEILGCSGRACGRILYIKPGAIDVYSVRDGTIEYVNVSDCVLLDPEGEKFSTGISITTARGSRTRYIYGRNNSIHARSIGGVGRLVGALDLYIIDHAGGTTNATIENVDLQISYTDPYGGQTNHATRPGHPVASGVYVQAANFNVGVFRNIKLDVSIDGTNEHGVVVGAVASGNIDGEVEFTGLKLKNINRNATAGMAGVYLQNLVKISDRNAKIEMSSGDPYLLQGNGDIDAFVDPAYWTPLIAASNPDVQSPWAATRRCYVHKIDLIVSQTVVQSDTNYSEYQFRNLGGSGDIFHWVRTRSTGADEANGVVVTGLTANAITRILTSKNVTSALRKAQHLFNKGAVLYIQRPAEVGTGSNLINARLFIHWAPY